MIEFEKTDKVKILSRNFVKILQSRCIGFYLNHRGVEMFVLPIKANEIELYKKNVGGWHLIAIFRFYNSIQILKTKKGKFFNKKDLLRYLEVIKYNLNL